MTIIVVVGSCIPFALIFVYLNFVFHIICYLNLLQVVKQHSYFARPAENREHERGGPVDKIKKSEKSRDEKHWHKERKHDKHTHGDYLNRDHDYREVILSLFKIYLLFRKSMSREISKPFLFQDTFFNKSVF